MLESRSLVKSELFPILDTLIDLMENDDDREKVRKMIRNEIYYYTELRHGKALLQMLWNLELAVKEQKFTEIFYRKPDGNMVRRRLRPVGIIFSGFYFYMTAFIEDIDKEEVFQNPQDVFPTIYRLDRIEKAVVSDEKFHIPYADRFEEGEFRKRIQFMYGGKLRSIEFEYYGSSPDCIFDRLPTAELIRKTENGYVIRAEVFGIGIEKWIRAKGKNVRILRPKELVDKIKNDLDEIREYYD